MSMKCITIDIESNGLLGDMVDFSSFPYKLKNDARIWCMSFTDVETMETKSLVGADITKKNVDDILKPYNFIIQHNGIKFDLLALKLFGLLDYRIGYLNESDELNGRDVRFIDTMILSRLIAPDRFGGHSLESWGKRLGDFKTDFRQQCIDAGIIDKKDPKGTEFKKFTPLMVPYCEQDTIVTAKIFLHLLPEFQEHSGWKQAFKMETKLADLAIRRESLGFWFDKDLALFCLEDLTNKMNELRDKVNPLLPPKPMGKTDLNYHTPPATQITKSGKLSSHIVKFTERHGGEILKEGDKFFMSFPWAKYELPFNLPIKTTVEADISHLDHVKHVLIDHGWEPTEWKERDITKDTKKVSLPPEKRLQVFERWLKETLEGKYKKHRLELTFELHKVKSVVELKEKITKQIESEFPIRVITSPPIRVGVEKELCPNLLALGDKVAFAKDFALYLTYKHRKSSIAGGDIEDMDLDEDIPNSGFLSLYRESDGRVPTPSIEIGANTGRYKHIGVCNIARPSSIYGKEMRSLFGCGGDAVQFGFDYASLEARIQSHYCWNYTDGEELAVSLLAEKPNDIHCYSEDTEILTREGWKTFGDVHLDLEVAQYNQETKELEWVLPDDVVWQDYEGEMLSIKGKNTDQLLTLNHRVYTESEDSKSGKIDLAKDLIGKKYTNRRFVCASTLKKGEYENPNLLRLLVATQADGHLAKDCSAIQFSFVKKSKINRLKFILHSLNATFSERFFSRKGRKETIIRVNASPLTLLVRSLLGENKSLSSNLVNLDLESRLLIINEIPYWDGTKTKNGVILDTTCEKTVDVVQSLASTSDFKSTKTKFTKTTTFGKTLVHRLFISLKRDSVCGVYSPVKKIVNYKGKIGCVSVPSTLVIVRRNGKVFISGNTVTGKRLGIPRSDAKSVNYMLMYGGSWVKAKKMLNLTDEGAKDIVNRFWESMPALKELKQYLEAEWEATGGKYIIGIDGRKLNVRSKHSIINLLFQSGGVVCAKYVSVMIMEKFEKLGFCIDPFINKPDICSMLEYHDEQQLYVNKDILKFKTFETEDEAKKFVDGWEDDQLSDISYGKKYYVTLPSIISKTIDDSIKEMGNLLKLNIPLGYAYSVSNNWFGCH